MLQEMTDQYRVTEFVALSNDIESMFTVVIKPSKLNQIAHYRCSLSQHLDDDHLERHELNEIRLIPCGLTIYEMTTMIDPRYLLLLATRNVQHLPKGKGISCIIGMHYTGFLLES